jgi:hypothetical protein
MNGIDFLKLGIGSCEVSPAAVRFRCNVSPCTLRVHSAVETMHEPTDFVKEELRKPS